MGLGTSRRREIAVFELVRVLGFAKGLGRAGSRIGVIWKQLGTIPPPTSSASLPKDRDMSLSAE